MKCICLLLQSVKGDRLFKKITAVCRENRSQELLLNSHCGGNVLIMKNDASEVLEGVLCTFISFRVQYKIHGVMGNGERFY